MLARKTNSEARPPLARPQAAGTRSGLLRAKAPRRGGEQGRTGAQGVGLRGRIRGAEGCPVHPVGRVHVHGHVFHGGPGPVDRDDLDPVVKELLQGRVLPDVAGLAVFADARLVFEDGL